MREKLKLNAGETLKHESHRCKGFMDEMDINTYLIVNKNNEVVGTVQHTEHMAVRGFRITQTLEQKDNFGKIIIDESW